MKKIRYVILCRFNSTRLPGKILREINGKKIIEYIIERLETVVDRADIVIATSQEQSDDPIAHFAAANNINIVRGSLSHVAERFFQASKEGHWDYITRINGDNIFLDVHVLSDMIKIANDSNFDFVSNVKNRTFPKGMSVEIVKTEHFKKLLPFISTSAFHSEHVTSYLYENDNNQNYYYHMNTGLPMAAGIQFALDDEEDLQRTQKIINQFNQPHTNYNLNEIYHIYKKIENDK